MIEVPSESPLLLVPENYSSSWQLQSIIYRREILHCNPQKIYQRYTNCNTTKYTAMCLTSVHTPTSRTHSFTNIFIRSFISFTAPRGGGRILLAFGSKRRRWKAGYSSRQVFGRKPGKLWRKMKRVFRVLYILLLQRPDSNEDHGGRMIICREWVPCGITQITGWTDCASLKPPFTGSGSMHRDHLMCYRSDLWFVCLKLVLYLGILYAIPTCHADRCSMEQQWPCAIQQYSNL